MWRLRLAIITVLIALLFGSKYYSSILPDIQTEYKTLEIEQLSDKALQYEKDVIQVHRQVYLKETLQFILVIVSLIMITFEIVLKSSTGGSLKDLLSGLKQDMIISLLMVAVITSLFIFNTQTLLSLYQ